MFARQRSPNPEKNVGGGDPELQLAIMEPRPREEETTKKIFQGLSLESQG